MRGNNRLFILASLQVCIVGSAVLVSSPAVAGQQATKEDARSALEAAINARAEAEAALERANEAILAAQSSLARMENQNTVNADISVSKSQRLNTKADLDLSSANHPQREDGVETRCGSGETADLVLQSDQRRVAMKPDEAGGLNWFTEKCLGLTKYADFKDSADLSIQLVGAKDTSVINVGPSFTKRKLTRYENSSTGDVSYKTSYTKFSVGGFAALGDDGNAAAFDLDKFEFNSGVGIKAGVEFGWGSRKEKKKIVNDLNAALAKARRECISHYLVVDPLEDDTASEVAPRDTHEIISKCEKQGFQKWLSDSSRKGQYWKQTIRPIWGYDDDPSWFIGAEARYAWTDFKYYPIFDTNTGNLLPFELPADFLEGKGKTKNTEEPFSFSAYAGFSHEFQNAFKSGSIGGALAVTYRREFTTPSAFKDQQICLTPTGATFDQCKKVNTAAPFENEGIVGSLAMKFQLPRYAFLPPLAVTVKPTYEFDINRWGVEVPFYLFRDSNGKLSSGIKFACQGDGKTRTGFELDDECSAVLFLGTKFGLTGAP